MANHVPNAVMARDNRVQRITVYQLQWKQFSCTTELVEDHLTKHHLGEYPLQGDSNKCTITRQAFTDTFPSFEPNFQIG